MKSRSAAAVLLAALAHFVFGAIWFTVLKQPWLASLGTTQEELMAKGGAGVAYLIALLANIVVATALSRLVTRAGASVFQGLRVGALAGGCLIFPAMITELIFEGRSFPGMLIAGLYPLIGCLIMGVVIGAVLGRRKSSVRQY